MERTQTTLRLPMELYEKLQQEAAKQNVSLNQLVVQILRWKLESHRA